MSRSKGKPKQCTRCGAWATRVSKGLCRGCRKRLGLETVTVIR